MAFLYRKLKRTGHIEKTYTKRWNSAYFESRNSEREVLKVYQLNDLFDLFPDYDFGENAREDEQNDSMQSSY